MRYAVIVRHHDGSLSLSGDFSTQRAARQRLGWVRLCGCADACVVPFEARIKAGSVWDGLAKPGRPLSAAKVLHS